MDAHYKQKFIAFIFGLVIVFSLCVYQLTETPPTWMDEGIITQVARNMALFNVHGVQIAPHEFVAGSFITTAYPVTFPISLAFRIFGPDFFWARLVMVIFILLFYSAVAFYFKDRYDAIFFGLTLLLLATFGPLYGHGKNVLGEVPGVCFLFLGLVFLKRLDGLKGAYFDYCFCALLLGLAIVTKPIFILIIPALFVTVYLYRSRIFITKKQALIFFVSLLVPIGLWFFVQFKSDSWFEILRHYSNPNNNPIWLSIIANIKRFGAEAQPIYTLGLVVVWTITGVIRYKKGKNIEPAETLAWILATLVLLAYIRTIGFYRYFFVTEVLSVIFLSYTLKEVITEKYLKCIVGSLVILVCLQGYQTFFNSWLATHTSSSRSALLQSHIGSFQPNTTTFFYQVPEAVNFLSKNNANYYQYVVITNALVIGERELAILKNSIPDRIVTSADLADNKLFAHYRHQEMFDRYVILTK